VKCNDYEACNFLQSPVTSCWNIPNETSSRRRFNDVVSTKSNKRHRVHVSWNKTFFIITDTATEQRLHFKLPKHFQKLKTKKNIIHRSKTSEVLLQNIKTGTWHHVTMHCAAVAYFKVLYRNSPGDRGKPWKLGDSVFPYETRTGYSLKQALPPQ
jgi:hypothetical protein